MKVVLEIGKDGLVKIHSIGKEMSEAHKRGYEKGYEAGVAEVENRVSMDEDSIRKEAFDKGHHLGYKKGFDAGMELAGKTAQKDIEEARSEGYTKGYFDGKRDGEMSKKDIPEEVKKHLEEALSWLN